MFPIFDRLLITGLGATLATHTSYSNAGWFLIGAGIAFALVEINRQLMRA